VLKILELYIVQINLRFVRFLDEKEIERNHIEQDQVTRTKILIFSNVDTCQLCYMAVKHNLLTLRGERRLRAFENRAHKGCEWEVEKASQ
jgi:hypothetical protein